MNFPYSFIKICFSLTCFFNLYMIYPKGFTFDCTFNVISSNPLQESRIFSTISQTSHYEFTCHIILIAKLITLSNQIINVSVILGGIDRNRSVTLLLAQWTLGNSFLKLHDFTINRINNLNHICRCFSVMCNNSICSSFTGQ